MAMKIEKMDIPELWFRRRKRYFKIMDPNDTGVATKDGIEVLAQRFEKYANMSEEQGKEMRALLLSFWTDVVKDPDAQVPLDIFYRLEYVIYTSPDLKDEQDAFIAEFSDSVFKIIDINHDGIISREEWRVWFKCLDVPDEMIADDSFDAIDLNKDGIMSNEEFVKGAREFMTTAESGKYDLFLGPLPDL